MPDAAFDRQEASCPGNQNPEELYDYNPKPTREPTSPMKNCPAELHLGAMTG